VNKLESDNFDIVLLDRDCKQGGSFYALDLSKFNPDKIISISAIPEYNNKAISEGVKSVSWKNWNDIDGWSNDVMRQIGMRVDKIMQKLA